MNTRGTHANPFRILLAEDNPGDADLLIEAFKRLKTPITTSVVVDGEDALAFLHRTGEYKEAPRVDLIVLDLNLPKMNGREVLQEIKFHKELLRIPVVVFSSSSAEHDLLDCYELHANGFMTKPVDLASYFSLAGDIERYWLQAAKLPARLAD
ncbi:MAG: response regulator [Bdellovibrionota bacterium]